MKKIFNNFKVLSLKYKILIVFFIVAITAGICTATYINKSDNYEENSVATVNTEIEEDDVEEIIEQVIEVPKEPEEIETVSDENKKEKEDDKKEDKEKVEKTVKYKDKEIKVPKATVAPANSAEDSQKQKSGGEAISAEKAVDLYENQGQSVGIDVSAHQGNINWKAVADSGIEFSMIRCGFRGQTAGQIYQDACFKKNVSGAVSNGVKVGIYFYSTAVNEEEAVQEAAWVVSVIQSYRITYPVAYDFEDFGRYRCSGVSGAQATANSVAFLNYVRSAGYTPIMYANKSDISSRFQSGSLSGYKFWLAHYTAQTNYTGRYQMWQYTSKGSVPGIAGNVDMDIAYFRYGAVAEPKHIHDFENGKETITKQATCTEEGKKVLRCSCGEVEEKVIPKLEHKYSEWTVVEPATVQKEGLQKRTCTICKKEEIKKIEKLKTDNKTNTSSKNNTVNKTNTNQNISVTNSSNVVKNTTNTLVASNIVNNTNVTNNTVQNNINNMTVVHEHKYTKETVIKEATCTEEGTKKLECECGYSKNQTIPAKGHSFGEWKIKTNATTEAEGIEYRECSKCNVVEEKPIPKLTLEPANTTEPNTNTVENTVP